jgi:hypothetical protein
VLAVEPGLRADLARRSGGRVLVVDYFASRRCSVTIGDLTAEFRVDPPADGFVELQDVDGIRTFAEQRLIPVLESAVLTVRLAGPPFARHLAVSLDPPSRWLDFLDGPGILAGKRRLLPIR